MQCRLTETYVARVTHWVRTQGNLSTNSVDKFRTRLRTIARAYPQDQIPKEEEMWKRVMMENLTESIKSRLKIYTSDGRGEAF